jgi:hypothetical protein
MNNKSEIKFFLKSAGSHPNQGYQWWRVQANKALTADEPSFIKELSSAEWLDREAFLLLILRNDQGIHLYVTALETQGREDFQGRKIRNDLAFTVSPEDESVLLDFACALLQDKDRVEKELNQKIRPEKSAGSKSGFTTEDYDRIIKWIRSFSKPSSRIDPKKGGWIAKNSEDNRKMLADLLKQHKLPDQTGFLVAVTRFSDPASFLETPNWWRVLTELEKSPNWRSLYPVKKGLAKSMPISVIVGIAVTVLLAAIGLAKILEPNWFQGLKKTADNVHSTVEVSPPTDNNLAAIHEETGQFLTPPNPQKIDESSTKMLSIFIRPDNTLSVCVRPDNYDNGLELSLHYRFSNLFHFNQKEKFDNQPPQQE